MIECRECERDVRGGHNPSCSFYDPAMKACTCSPGWEPDCPVHALKEMD